MAHDQILLFTSVDEELYDRKSVPDLINVIKVNINKVSFFLNFIFIDKNSNFCGNMKEIKWQISEFCPFLPKEYISID